MCGMIYHTTLETFPSWIWWIKMTSRVQVGRSWHQVLLFSVPGWWVNRETFDGQKKLCWSPEFMSKTTGTVFVMLERGKYFVSCGVIKDRKYETWLREILKMVEIRGWDLIFRRGEGPRNYKSYLHRMKIKSIMRIYLREISDIGSKTNLKIL